MKIKNELVIFWENGLQFTTSLKVAESFGKQHHNVTQKIKNLDCSASFRVLNYKATKKVFKIGITTEIIPFYEINRAGFVFLAMGFTGFVAAVHSPFRTKYF